VFEAEQTEFGSKKRCVESKSKSFFWVAFIFERMTLVDFGEKAFVENPTQKLPKSSVSKCEIG